MLEWKHDKLKVWYARTKVGSAIIQILGHDVLLDMWDPDQMDIGTELFPTVSAAMERAEAILDPRSTAWERLDHPGLED